VPELDEARAAQELGLGPEHVDWLSALAAVEMLRDQAPLLDEAVAEERLRWLGLAEVDRREIHALWRSIDGRPAVEWLLARAVARQRQLVGQIDGEGGPWLPLPVRWGALARCFWVLVFLATIDDVRKWHAARGVPDDVSQATLADLGRHLRLYRRRTGQVGLDVPWWIDLHVRGALFALGRLQFNSYRLLSGPGGPLFWYDAAEQQARGPGWRAGDRVLGVHIPESGPLDPAACEASFGWAGTFFAQHLPEYAADVATCTSWLLDDQLASYLPASSNIMRFQQRFEVVPGARDDDGGICHFVFGRSPQTLGEVVPRTRLERAIVDHLAAGQHWHMRTGWLRLSARSG